MRGHSAWGKAATDETGHRHRQRQRDRSRACGSDEACVEAGGGEAEEVAVG